MCFELSFVCCNPDFHESMFENIMLFAILIEDTALSAKWLTHLLHAFTIYSSIY